MHRFPTLILGNPLSSTFSCFSALSHLIQLGCVDQGVFQDEGWEPLAWQYFSCFLHCELNNSCMKLCRVFTLSKERAKLCNLQSGSPMLRLMEQYIRFCSLSYFHVFHKRGSEIIPFTRFPSPKWSYEHVWSVLTWGTQGFRLYWSVHLLI